MKKFIIPITAILIILTSGFFLGRFVLKENNIDITKIFSTTTTSTTTTTFPVPVKLTQESTKRVTREQRYSSRPHITEEAVKPAEKYVDTVSSLEKILTPIVSILTALGGVAMLFLNILNKIKEVKEKDLELKELEQKEKKSLLRRKRKTDI